MFFLWSPLPFCVVLTPLLIAPRKLVYGAISGLAAGSGANSAFVAAASGSSIPQTSQGLLGNLFVTLLLLLSAGRTLAGGKSFLFLVVNTKCPGSYCRRRTSQMLLDPTP